MRRTRLLRRLAPLLLVASAAGAEQPVVVVTPGSARTFRAAVQDFADGSPEPDPLRARRFREVLESALAFSGVFENVAHAAFLAPEATVSLDGGEPVVCTDWSQIGADALVEGQLARGAEFSVEFRVWDVTRCTRLARKRYTQPATADPGYLAKRVADDVVAAFIGIRGVASTEIAFVSNRSGHPEIYVMGADGSHQRSATSNRSINNFPNWSPDGDTIIYTSYRMRNSPLLFLSSRGRGRPGRLLPSLRGDHSEYRGVYSPDGRQVALVLSQPGEATEIHVADPDGRGMRRLTRNRAIDISPSWSPDGRRLAFVSDRTGSPQVYVMDADGGNQKRLTFQGSYNTNPAWSPDGRWIAYETRVGGQFDIWLIDPEGSVNVPLITHPLTDESPTWAPNSRKLAFSSRRRGRADVYVVDIGSDAPLRITQGAGDNTSPSWGPFPR
jgi:TolB protein